MHKWTITLTIIILGIGVIITLFSYPNKLTKLPSERTYFLAKSYWKKGYPFLVPFTNGTTITNVVKAFFPTFTKIFIKNGKTWTSIDPLSKIYEDITFKIEV